MLARHLPLHDDVGPFWTTIGVVEQPSEERRRESERWVRHHPVRRAREANRPQVASDHSHRVDDTGAADGGAEPFDPRVVALDGPDLDAGHRKRDSERAGASADVDDEAAGSEVEPGDEPGDQRSISEEVLAQQTTTYVALAAPALPAHGNITMNIRPR